MPKYLIFSVIIFFTIQMSVPNVFSQGNLAPQSTDQRFKDEVQRNLDLRMRNMPRSELKKIGQKISLIRKKQKHGFLDLKKVRELLNYWKLTVKI